MQDKKYYESGISIQDLLKYFINSLCLCALIQIFVLLQDRYFRNNTQFYAYRYGTFATFKNQLHCVTMYIKISFKCCEIFVNYF